jgi:excisionase family DNA binding protein
MLTVEMVAKQFNVSPRTILRLVESRQMRALRIGRQWRFKKEWIEEWMQQQTTDAGSDQALG